MPANVMSLMRYAEGKKSLSAPSRPPTSPIVLLANICLVISPKVLLASHHAIGEDVGVAREGTGALYNIGQAA